MMTAILLAILAFAIGGTIGVCWSYFGPPARNLEQPPPYPACVSLELVDRPLRRAWDSLEPDEQAQLLRERPDKLREDLSLLAWMTELGVETVSAEPAVTDYGMAYG